MSFDTKKLQDENEEQYLWRLGQAKDNGLIDLEWDDIAALMNSEFRTDESEYRTSSAYRKPYQYSKRMFDAGVFKDKTEKSYANDLVEAKHELRREKQKLFDERIALNKMLREQARTDNDLAYLEKLIGEKSADLIPNCPSEISISSNKDMIICVSDLHFGIQNDSPFGRYSPEIAKNRIGQYLQRIECIQSVHDCEDAYVIILGDIISGNIHFSTQLENRENVIEQIKGASELLVSFIYGLCLTFNHVYINGVAGNHSRISYKDDVLRGERLDNLIPWYVKASLKHIDNISFVDDGNYDATICNLSVRGNEYLGVHGDFDSFSEAGVSKIVMMLGYKPTGIFYGHMHHNSFDDINGVKIIRSGSFSGTGDNYSIQKRLYGEPGQMVAVVDSKGIDCCYPIDLN